MTISRNLAELAPGASTGGVLATTNGGTGTNVTFTLGSVLFAGASGVYTQDNTNFFWDDSNNRLGLGTATPAARFDISGGEAANTVAVAASAIDCSAGSFFTKTASGALTWTFTNVPASRSVTVILQLTNGGTGAQTWPAAVKWPSGTAPTLTTSGTDVLGFVTTDGGTVWSGLVLGLDVK